MKDEKFKDIETIRFDNYVDENAINVLTDFSYNKFITKSTGVGITTAAINYTGGNLIIISPNITQIIDKSVGEYKSDKQLFIYGKTHDLWGDAMNYFENTDVSNQNLIINCTPNQIVKLFRNMSDILDKITEIPVLVDEVHAYTQDCLFRPEMGFCMELVHKRWKTARTYTTATPIYNGYDIPDKLEVKWYDFKRNDDPKKLLQYSTNLNDAYEFVYNEHHKNRKVAVFSNNINIHKYFKDLVTKNGTGDALRIKLAPFKGDTSDQTLTFEECDVIVFSSSYYAGFDINHDCSVCIISEQGNDAVKICITNLVQAYGRCRKQVQNALYVNTTNEHRNDEVHYPKSWDEVTTSFNLFKDDFKYFSSVAANAKAYHHVNHHNCITESLDVNRAYLFHNVLNKINDYQQYNKDVFVETMRGYNFEVVDYTSTNTQLKKKSSVNFQQRILNLTNIKEHQLLQDYDKIKYNTKNKNKGTFSSKLGLEYLTAYLLKVTNASVLIDKLEKGKNLRRNDFYKSLNLFLRANVDSKYYTEQLSEDSLTSALRMYQDDNISKILKEQSEYTNDWQLYYSIYKTTTQKLSPELELEIKILSEITDNEIYNKYNGKNQRVRDAYNAILKHLNEASIQLNDKQLASIKDAVKETYKKIDKNETVYKFSRKTLLNKIVDSHLFLLSNGEGSYRSKYIKNREYNAITQLSKVFRKTIPLRYLSIDLTSAYPQIVDKIIGTNIGLSVYKNLMEKKKISRTEAKQFYNMTLNNHKFSIKKAKSIFLDCGYSEEDSVKLAKMTAQVPEGSFYEAMTKYEKKIIEQYQNILSVKSHRFHDAIIVSEQEIQESNITLPTRVDNYLYHIDVFNDESAYSGKTTDIKHSSKVTIDNYIWLNN